MQQAGEVSSVTDIIGSAECRAAARDRGDRSSPVDGYLLLDKAKFAASFAADVKPEVAEFMAASQVPWGVNALSGAVTAPAWRAKKSWYLVASEDKMIPPPAQRIMAARAGSTVREVAASHSVYVSQPAAVASIIEDAVKDAE